jgi:hypothetical protein
MEKCGQLHATATFKALDSHHCSNASMDVLVKRKIPAQSAWPVVSHVIN